MATQQAPGDQRSSERRRSDVERGVLLVVAMAAVMWVVEIVDKLGADVDQHGIEPRDVDGLPGIVLSPFLHGGFDHLIGNTIPFVLLGAGIALGGLARVVLVTVIVGLVAGIGVWLVGPGDSITIGASGIVFGYATYLMTRGLFSRHLAHLAGGALVLVVYGSTLLFGLVPTPGVSWQGHLFGAIGGVVAGRLMHTRQSRREAAAEPL